MPKRGRLSGDEIAYLKKQGNALPAEEIARKLNRTVDMVRAFVKDHRHEVAVTPELAKVQEKVQIRAELRSSEKWKRLKQELTADEMVFFEEEYCKLMSQFKSDVLPTEETQIFDAIKFEILKSRNMVERRRAREDIKRLEKMQSDFLKSFAGDITKMRDDDKALALNLETQLQAARAAEQARTGEYVKLQEQHANLMKTLKATRDQRVKQIESSKQSFLGLIKELQQREVADAEGRHMELMRLATNKEYVRLGEPHEYEDGQVDRPILSPETVEGDFP